MIDLNSEYILENTVKYEMKPCIYFLVSENEIVYVGQTLSLPNRLLSHKKNKEFDSYYAYECEKEDMTKLECYFIIKFNPKYNKLLPWESDEYLTLNMLKNRFGIGKIKAKKMITSKGAEPVFKDYYHAEVFDIIID